MYEGKMMTTNTLKNHRVVVAKYDGPEVLQLVAANLLEPKIGEARVKVLAAGTIDPIVAARILLPKAARAHELLERSGYAGKVVLEVA